MTRIAITLALACALLTAASASGQQQEERKRVLDARIDNLESKIERASEREGVLSADIEVATEKIEGLQTEIGAAEARLDQLESVLDLHQRRLNRLDELVHLQTSRLVFLRRQHGIATKRLNARLVEIYTSDPTEPLSVVLQARSFVDMLDHIEFLDDIGRRDEEIVQKVTRAKRDMRELRAATKRTRDQQAQTTQEVEARTFEQRAVRDRLAWSQRELATARRDRQSTLSSVQEDKLDAETHVAELQAQSAALAARIQAAQAAAQDRSSYSVPAAAPAPQSSASAFGFIWPVHGVVTSSFGWRWGRMHEGIDIAVASGTPVVAASGGTVIVAGWLGGYGNLVVIDHGNGIATAYGHNTNVTVFVGQTVGQGQLIAYSGNTGNSTGPHVHFEVRVGGGAVDPFGYL